MTDVHSEVTRSYNMSRIKGKNTKPELLVRSFLFANGFRYRLHKKDLPGKPDIVLTKYRIVIFVNGCFWHGHNNCKYFVIPKTRTAWWINKINTNKQKDYVNILELQKQGWNVIITWECELSSDKRIKYLENLVQQLTIIKTNNYEKY